MSNFPDSLSRGTMRSRRLRLACDTCHRAKIRCTGGSPCKKCENTNAPCQYSYTQKLGKPKGSRNKRTLARLNASSSGRQGPARTPDRLLPLSLPVSNTPSPTIAETPSRALLDYQPLEADLECPWVDPFFDLDATVYPPPPDGGLCQLEPTYPTLENGTENGQSNEINTFDSTQQHPDTRLTSPIGTTINDDIYRVDVQPRVVTQKPNATTPSHIPASYPPNRAPFGTSITSSLLFENPSPIQREGGTSCSCLRLLTEQLYLLHSTERNNLAIPFDRVLSMASTFIGCADGVLHCVLCRLDSTVLRLIMTALQTIFSWVYMGYSEQPGSPKLPPIHFGDWRVPEQDGKMVKLLLTKHMLSLCRSVVRILQLRVDEMHLLAKVQTRFHCMDTASMSVLAERLSSSLSDVIHLVQHCGKGKDVIPDSPSSQKSPEKNETVAESG